MNKQVSLDEKLLALQASDPFRKWLSLDDQRVCILCEKIINGRMIDVRQDSKGSYWLNCPTPGCAGSPRDWFTHKGTSGSRPPEVIPTPSSIQPPTFHNPAV